MTTNSLSSDKFKFFPLTHGECRRNRTSILAILSHFFLKPLLAPNIGNHRFSRCNKSQVSLFFRNVPQFTIPCCLAVLVALTSAETEKKATVAETAVEQTHDTKAEETNDSAKSKRGLHEVLGDYSSFGGYGAYGGQDYGQAAAYEAHDYGQFDGHHGLHHDGHHALHHDGHHALQHDGHHALHHDGHQEFHHDGHDFGHHDFGASEHHHEHVKHITIEKKVPVPYTVTKHIPYTVEKKVRACQNNVLE